MKAGFANMDAVNQAVGEICGAWERLYSRFSPQEARLLAMMGGKMDSRAIWGTVHENRGTLMKMADEVAGGGKSETFGADPLVVKDKIKDLNKLDTFVIVNWIRSFDDKACPAGFFDRFCG